MKKNRKHVGCAAGSGQLHREACKTHIWLAEVLD